MDLARAAKSLAVAVTVLAAAALVSGDARAGGYGVYLEAEYSDASLDSFIAFNTEKVNRDFESGMGGLGFVYDTNVSRDEPFNYRFKIGYRFGRRDWDENTKVTFPRAPDQQDPDTSPISFNQDAKDAQGVTLNQTLAWGFFRNQTVRVWAGPAVRLNIDWYGVATDLDVVDVGIGGGPELGINYHLNEQISLSTSLSYSYLYLSENFDTIGDDKEINGSQHFVALSISVFFRTESDRWGK
jgi:hypothetical protein